MNFNALGVPLAVTYCPLTGSSIVFDRTSVRGVEFGVSGLLFQNNLVKYERSSVESDVSLWDPGLAPGILCYLLHHSRLPAHGSLLAHRIKHLPNERIEILSKPTRTRP